MPRYDVEVQFEMEADTAGQLQDKIEQALKSVGLKWDYLCIGEADDEDQARRLDVIEMRSSTHNVIQLRRPKG